jgi:hypothetical protein
MDTTGWVILAIIGLPLAVGLIAAVGYVLCGAALLTIAAWDKARWWGIAAVVALAVVVVLLWTPLMAAVGWVIKVALHLALFIALLRMYEFASYAKGEWNRWS